MSDGLTPQQRADLGVIVDAARLDVAALSQARIRYLAQILGNTRPNDEGTEGEWAIRLWEAGVRPPLPTPRGFTNWGDE